MKAAKGLGIWIQALVGVATPIGTYVIATRKGGWVVAVVFLMLMMNASANAISLQRESLRSRAGGPDTRTSILLRTVAGLSALSALTLLLEAVFG